MVKRFYVSVFLAISWLLTPFEVMLEPVMQKVQVKCREFTCWVVKSWDKTQYYQKLVIPLKQPSSNFLKLTKSYRATGCFASAKKANNTSGWRTLKYA